MPPKRRRLAAADQGPVQARSSIGRGMRGDANITVGEAEGEEAESRGVCCCCGTDLGQTVYAVAACSHTFCCACLLEQATVIGSPHDSDYCCGECGQQVQAFTLAGGGRENRSCEMPRRFRAALRDASTASHAPDEGEERGRLLSLPSPLLGRLWPSERVVVGLRVCHHLRREISEHAGSILLVQRPLEAVFAESLARDLRRFPDNIKVALEWQSGPSGLSCVASLGTGLAHLDLSDNDLEEGDSGVLVEVLSKCKAMAHLVLNCNRIGAEGAGRLAGVLGECKALAHLDLRGNFIGDEGAGRLAGVLGGCRALAHLDLGGNDIGAEGAGLLAEGLRECKALAHLSLSDNRIVAEEAGRLMGVLGECRTLSYLNFCNNDLSDDGAGRVAEVLGKCKALAHLDLTYNRIGAEGAGRLAGVLGECRTLARLELGGNWIGDEGMVRVAGVLGECRALAHLGLSQNGIGDDGAGWLAGVLGECRTLAHLDLSQNSIGDEVAGRLADACAGRCTILT